MKNKKLDEKITDLSFIEDIAYIVNSSLARKYGEDVYLGKEFYQKMKPLVEDFIMEIATSV